MHLISVGSDALGQWRRRNPDCLATLIDPPHGEVSNEKRGEWADGARHQMAAEDARDPQRTLDSSVWNGFTFRPDDIVIATWGKSGTMWTQQQDLAAVDGARVEIHLEQSCSSLS